MTGVLSRGRRRRRRAIRRPPRGLAPGPTRARDLFDLVDRAPCRRAAPTADDDRGHHLRHRRRSPAPGPAARPTSAAERLSGPVGLLRHAVAARAAARPRPADRRRPTARGVGAGGRRARAVAGARRRDDRPRPITCCRRRSGRRRCGCAGKGPATRRAPNAFLLRAPGGEPLVEVSMSPDAIAAARRALAADASAPSCSRSLGLTLLLLIGPRSTGARRRAARARSWRRPSPRSRCSSRPRRRSGRRLPWSRSAAARRAPCCCSAGVTGRGAVALLAGPAVRLRIGLRARRTASRRVAPLASCWSQLLAGAAVARLLVAVRAAAAARRRSGDGRPPAFLAAPVARAAGSALLIGILACMSPRSGPARSC